MNVEKDVTVRWTNGDNCAPPEDIEEKVDITIKDTGDGITVKVKGNGMLCIGALGEAYVETIATSVKDMPVFMRELGLRVFVREFETDLRKALGLKKEEEK